MNADDYSKYYDLEHYLFGEVAEGYGRTKAVSTFDFFCIVIWKANRSKSKIAERLLARGHANLDEAVQVLVQAISAACDAKERLRVLIQDWGFCLPMASAILTVLFQHEFTIYDERVCQVLNDFKDAQYKTRFDDLWNRYSEYIRQVNAAINGQRALRDKDRWLWGKSFASQLRADINAGFRRNFDDTELEA